MIHHIRHQSRDYYREKSFLLHTYTFLCEHSRKKASFYHEFFTTKKISLSLFPCTPPSRCKRWSLSILNFCPSPICYFSFISLLSFATELLNSEVFTAPFPLRILRNNKTEFFTAQIFISHFLLLFAKKTTSANLRFYTRNHPYNPAYNMKKELFSLKTEILSSQLPWNYLRLTEKESPLSNERTSVISERISVVNRKNLRFFYIIIKYKRVKSNYISL